MNNNISAQTNRKLKRDMICKIEGCDKLVGVGAREMCSKHYWRFKRNGTLSIKPKLSKEELESRHKNQLDKWKRKLRMDLFNILGGCKCMCGSCSWHNGPCLVTDENCMQFEHIGGGGSKEHKKFGPYQVYLYYRTHPEEAKKKLQPFCANCNWSKRVKNNELKRAQSSSENPN